MRAFELYDATTIKEAVDLLKANASKNARVVAGGSDLVGGLMKDWVHGKGLAIPDVLVDITTVKDLVGISESETCGVHDHGVLLAEGLGRRGVSCTEHWLLRHPGSLRAARAEVPRSSHAAWDPPSDRFDPVARRPGNRMRRRGLQVAGAMA